MLFTKYGYGDKIKENEIGGACSTYRGNGRCM
jgi:hypothetical protein